MKNLFTKKQGLYKVEDAHLIPNITPEILEKLKNPAFENLTILTCEDDLKHILANLSYVCLNLKIFKGNPANRGGVLIPANVTKISNLLDSGEFMHDMSELRVAIGTWEYVDGHNRNFVFDRENEPCVVKFVYPKTIEDISNYNSAVDSRWSETSGFNAAYVSGKPTAIAINKIRHELLAKHDMKKGELPTAELYAIAKKNHRFMNGGKWNPKVGDYNENLVERIQSLEYVSFVDKYAKTKKHLDGIHEKKRICKFVMAMHFNETSAFNFEIFFEGFKTRHAEFRDIVHLKEGITELAIDIFEKERDVILINSKNL